MQAHEALADEEISQASSQERADGDDDMEEVEEDEEQEEEEDAEAAVDHDNVSNFLSISISATYDTSHASSQHWHIFAVTHSFISILVTE